MNQWDLLTPRFVWRILSSMALCDSPLSNTWRDTSEVGLRLQSFRAAIEDARRNGWREADQLGDEMETYLAAVQPEAPRAEQWAEGARRNNWRQ